MKQIFWPGLILGALILFLIGFTVYWTESPWALVGLWAIHFVKISNPEAKPKISSLAAKEDFPREEIPLEGLSSSSSEPMGHAASPWGEDDGNPRVIN